MSTEKVVTEASPEKARLIVFFVDGEKHETSDHSLTVAQILEIAGLDPKTHYLIELRGEHQIKYENSNEELHLRDNEKFISVFSGPTPLS